MDSVPSGDHRVHYEEEEENTLVAVNCDYVRWMWFSTALRFHLNHWL